MRILVVLNGCQYIRNLQNSAAAPILSEVAGAAGKNTAWLASTSRSGPAARRFKRFGVGGFSPNHFACQVSQ